MRVLNKRVDKIPPDAIYVGRPSKWGNPFKFPSFYASRPRDTRLAVRKSVVGQYREYVMARPWLLRMIQEELKGKDLVCWCAPLPCHADVLLELANK